MKNPKAQPKRKPRAKRATPRAVPSTRETNLGGVNPAFIRLPSHSTHLGECLPINHPRGKEGGWGD